MYQKPKFEFRIPAIAVKLPPRAALIYSVLKTYAENDVCSVSNHYIAQTLSITRSCVMNWLKYLIDQKHISKEIDPVSGQRVFRLLPTNIPEHLWDTPAEFYSSL